MRVTCAWLCISLGWLALGLAIPAFSPNESMFGQGSYSEAGNESHSTAAQAMTGFLLCFWGCICLAISLVRTTGWRLLTMSALVPVVIVGLAVSTPKVLSAMAVALEIGAPFRSAPPRLWLELLVGHAVFAAIGVWAQHLGASASARAGFRIGNDPALRQAANRSGGAALHRMSCIALIVSVALHAAGTDVLAIAVSGACFLLSPIVASVAAVRAQRAQARRLGSSFL